MCTQQWGTKQSQVRSLFQQISRSVANKNVPDFFLAQGAEENIAVANIT
jgi:hypothetical protein